MRLRDLVPARFEHTAAIAWHGALETAQRARFWRWDAVAVAPPLTAFVGRRGEWEAARGVLRLEDAVAAPFGAAVREPGCAIACDAPLPGALHVAGGVRLLRRFVPGEDPLRAWSEKTRQHAVKMLQRPWRWRRATDPARIQRDMLAPFAQARHGARAFVVPLHEVERLAHEGRLDELLLGDEPIGAHLAASQARDGERVWVSLRVGYVRRVFEDRALLAEANAVNWAFAARSAVEEGCAVHDMGLSPAAPDGGLLQFKRQRAGVLDPEGSISTFWLHLPEAERPQRLWRAPVFALESRGIALHLGLASASDEEVVKRFRTLSFEGLCAVRLHSGRDVPRALLGAIAAQFRKGAPPIEVAS